MTVPAASVSGRQRVAAAVALLAAVLTIAVAVVEAISDFPEGLGVLGLIAIALGAAWSGLSEAARNASWGSSWRCWASSAPRRC